jgi:uncharacterized protein
MPARRPLVAVCLAVAFAGCGGGDGDGNPAGGADPRAVIEADGREVVVQLEVADTEEERARGLMDRESLPANAGMVFLYQDDAVGGYWMKNTLIPLSIAFFAEDGRILRILDMEPCRADPCPVYEPGVVYRGALEVNRGAFRRWGVSEGDRIRLERVPGWS